MSEAKTDTAMEEQAGSAHCPLPWHPVFTGEEDDWGIGCVGRTGPVVAQMLWRHDAEFIVLAANHHHELVAACRLALEPFDPSPEEATRRREIVRAVLAKVEGL